MRPVHPYANPDVLPQTLVYQPHAQYAQVEADSMASPLGPSGSLNQKASPNHQQGYHLPPTPASPARYLPSAPMPLASPHEGLPTKMAPWQHVASSPTFQLLSLEEAQAMKAKQRSAAMGTASTTPCSSSPPVRALSINTTHAP